MTVRRFNSPVTADTTLVTTAETVVATLSNVGTTRPGEPIALKGWLQLTTGTSTTGVTVRIRRDSLSGAVVGEGNVEQVSAAAGSTEAHEIETQDSFTGEVPSQTYVLTVAQTAASANGSVLQAWLEAEVGN
jgi:hypothetical protein